MSTLYMPRKIIDTTEPIPFHVTTRTNNKEFLFEDMEYSWKLINDLAYEMTIIYEVQIHVVTLMNNHYHMIITCPIGNLAEVLRFLNTNYAISYNKKYGRCDHVFGKRYHRTALRNQFHFMAAYKYVVRNPVRANICSLVEEYKYCTFNALIGLERSMFPIYNVSRTTGFGISENYDEMLEFLNEPFDSELEAKIGATLKKSEFKIGKRDRSGFQIKLNKKSIS